MKSLGTSVALVSLLAISGAAYAKDPAGAAALNGQWDAVLTRNGVDIPFRLDINQDGGELKGVLYDGWKPYETTTSASFKDNQLQLNIGHYLTTINATFEGGKLTGSAVAQNRESSSQYSFRATKHVKTNVADVKSPQIAGTYVIPLDAPSSKGEKAFRFVVEQRGAEVAGSILRIDGDTGAYTGAFKDGKWVLSHFDGSRPGVITVTPKTDGTLEIQQQSDRPGAIPANSAANEYGRGATPDGRYATKLVAYRAEVAKAKGLPEPDDFLTHTTARDPNELFTFNAPDIDGKLISQDDPRFKGKVVLAIVTGTWCPNCHDEAQYLVELDKKYRDKGLAIVALSFEEPEQQDSLERARHFIDQYGVKYTYLFPGAPAQMWEKVPQLNHLDTWPATVFVGRDGKVKAVHSGFASPASGEFHTQLKKDFETRIEQLLVEKAPVQQASLTERANLR